MSRGMTMQQIADELVAACEKEAKEDGPLFINIYAIFQTLLRPDVFVAEVGTWVYTDFCNAWDELLNPSWGERAIYTTAIQPNVLGLAEEEGQPALPYKLLRGRVDGWRILEPDDLTALQAEMKFAGERPFFTETQIRDSNSWYSKMCHTVSNLRYKDLGATVPASETITGLEGSLTMGELRTILEMLPQPYAVKLNKVLSAFAGIAKNNQSIIEGLTKEVVHLKQSLTSSVPEGITIAHPMTGAPLRRPGRSSDGLPIQDRHPDHLLGHEARSFLDISDDLTRNIRDTFGFKKKE